MAETSLEKPPVRLWIETRDSFADELADFGEAVTASRRGHDRSPAEKEAYCLRAYLVAARLAGTLVFPVIVHASEQRDQQAGWPDFVLETGNTLRGVEISEAGSPDFQKWVTKAHDEPRAVPFPDDRGHQGDRPERMALDDIVKGVEKKQQELAKQSYRQVADCELLVYVMSEGWVLADKEKVANRLQTELGRFIDDTNLLLFRHIHIVSDSLVILDAGGPEQRAVRTEKAYEMDYSDWALEQAALARDEKVNRLDLWNIAGELEALSKKDRRSRDSHLRNLLMHLLKYAYQPEKRSGSWKTSIRNARTEIWKISNDSPSLSLLKQRSEDALGVLSWEYDRARQNCLDETRLSADQVPVVCPFTLEQILDEDFWPEPSAGPETDPPS
ncbi:MAG: DUF29 family protein [Alphaproteobacteria bacterium]|jgi:hypothetical protein|nr:DUF29 family protein [Alphaproteobacteria bacterium]